MSVNHEERRAWTITLAFFSVFLLLLFAVALFPQRLAGEAFAGITWGQWLFILLHILPVIGAWWHIRKGTPRVEEGADQP